MAEPQENASQSTLVQRNEMTTNNAMTDNRSWSILAAATYQFLCAKPLALIVYPDWQLWSKHK